MLQIMERNKQRADENINKGFRGLPYKLNFAGAQIQCLLGQKIKLFEDYRNKKRNKKRNNKPLLFLFLLYKTIRNK